MRKAVLLSLAIVLPATAATLTTDHGTPVGDNDNSLTAGAGGGVLLQDFHLIQKLARFDRERIPERVVHARGVGAYGTFTSAGDFSASSHVAMLGSAGKKTPMFVRFSTVIHGKDSPETVRDPRGFALKFYTEEGNWDIVGNNLPVFFIRDAMKFPDMVHSLKPDPVLNQQDPNRYYDFFSHIPESTHMLTRLLSDFGIPADYRHMDGSSVHAFKLVNAKGEVRYAKFAWKTNQGVKNLTAAQASSLQATDFSHATRDLYGAIGRGEKPSWDLFAQVITPDQLDDFDFYPLDPTKIWPEDKVPSVKLGSFTLDKVPDGFHRDSEQAAFSPGVLPSGIEPSEDRLLQGRLFSYADTQRYRLGVNYLDLEVNRAKTAVTSNNQDGTMAFGVTSRANEHVNYAPSVTSPVTTAADARFAPLALTGATQQSAIAKYDDFAQAGAFYRGLSKAEKESLLANFIGDLGKVQSKEIRSRIAGFLIRADAGFGGAVAKGVGVTVAEATSAADAILARR